MVGLLPAVHRLLVLLPAFEDQHVDRAWVGDVAVLLKALADVVSDEGGRDVQCIEGDDFRGLVGE